MQVAAAEGAVLRNLQIASEVMVCKLVIQQELPDILQLTAMLALSEFGWRPARESVRISGGCSWRRLGFLLG